MKIILGALLVFYFALNNCFAQIGKPIEVSILKESKEIDNLMDKVFSDENFMGQKNKVGLGDSCWMLEMFKWDSNDISFQVVRSSKSAVNYRFNRHGYDKSKYGYFTFKGNMVFAWTKDNFDGFFGTTGNHRQFNFIFYSNGTSAPGDISHHHSIHYKFTNGHFSIEGGPPTVKQLEN